MPDSSPHSELADIIRGEVGLIATSEGSTPALDALSIARIENALTGLVEQKEALQVAVDDALVVFVDTQWEAAYRQLGSNPAKDPK